MRSIPTTPESPLRKEWRLFKEGFSRLVNAYLNTMFDLSPKASRGRFWAFVILFFLTIILLSLINYPLTRWLEHAQDIFLYFFNEPYRAAYTAGDPISNFVLFVLQVFIDPRTLRFFPLLLAPYFISLQSAAIYLADIFNLDDVSIARKHIIEVALGGSDETIHISKGEIVDEDKKSANFLIGGPGKVLVDLDSAALFEKPDGTPHVIGPTGKEPGGKATIEGFERFREAIDLRDHFVEARNDRSDGAPSISSRSMDGIPIIATDVRFIYSVDRNDEKFVNQARSVTSDFPYPFSSQAIENIVYKATSKVTPDQLNPSTFVFIWRDNMVSLIRSELAKFMSKNELNKYLASIGLPEADRTAQRENMLTDEARNLLPPDMKPPDKKDMPKKPEFIPRPQIKDDLFSKFAENFNRVSRERGVKLHWVGIGTWKSPVEKVFDKHIEAWKTSQESAKMEGNNALKKFNAETTSQKMAGLIQEIPLGSYHQARAERTDYNAIKRTMLVDFKNQLAQAKDLWITKGEMAPADVEEAIRIILRVLGTISPGGPTDSPGNSEPPPDEPLDGNPKTPNGNPKPQGGDSPSSPKTFAPDNNDDDTPPTPGFAYADLIGLVGGDGTLANRLIEHERGQFPNDSQEALVTRAIDRLLKDRR